MLEKEFAIVKKSVNIRALVFLAVMVIFIIFSQLDKRFGISDDLMSNTWSIMFSVLLLILALFLAFWVSTLKNHMVLGKLQFNPIQIKIETEGVVELIPVAKISSMGFEFNNIDGAPHVSGALFGLFSGITSSDGSGNYLRFRFNSVGYAFNIVIGQKEDYHALRHLFKEIYTQHGLAAELTGKRINSAA